MSLALEVRRSRRGVPGGSVSGISGLAQFVLTKEKFWSEILKSNEWVRFMSVPKDVIASLGPPDDICSTRLSTFSPNHR
jgi:hypothetical protein